MTGFRVGDRVRTAKDPEIINRIYADLVGVITEDKGEGISSRYLVTLDPQHDQIGRKSTLTFSAAMLSLEEPEPTEEEILALFGVKSCYACHRPFEEE